MEYYFDYPNFDIINFAQRTTHRFQNDDYFLVVLPVTVVVFFSLMTIWCYHYDLPSLFYTWRTNLV